MTAFTTTKQVQDNDINKSFKMLHPPCPTYRTSLLQIISVGQCVMVQKLQYKYKSLCFVLYQPLRCVITCQQTNNNPS